jgi:superfamily II RNA helicase
MASYKNKIKQLKKLDFIKEMDELGHGNYTEQNQSHFLTPKGDFAKNLYSNEVILTELFHLPFLHKFSDLELLTLLAAIVYEERRLDYFMIKGSEKTYSKLLKRLNNTLIAKEMNKMYLRRMINFVQCWATGGSFLELMKLSNLAEGDIIRFFRRLIDTLNQLQHATKDEELRDRMQKMIEMIDRDLVSADI